MLKPKRNPQQKLRVWQGSILFFIFGQGQRSVKEEKNEQKSNKVAANRNDMGSAKSFAKEILMSRKAVNILIRLN